MLVITDRPNGLTITRESDGATFELSDAELPGALARLIERLIDRPARMEARLCQACDDAHERGRQQAEKELTTALEKEQLAWDGAAEYEALAAQAGVTLSA
jgi:hypothetical protein